MHERDGDWWLRSLASSSEMGGLVAREAVAGVAGGDVVLVVKQVR